LGSLAPPIACVSDCAISRIGTRMSGREPSRAPEPPTARFDAGTLDPYNY